jgi:hypothetical protein
MKTERHLKIANRKTEFGVVSITIYLEIFWKFFFFFFNIVDMNCINYF